MSLCWFDGLIFERMERKGKDPEGKSQGKKAEPTEGCFGELYKMDSFYTRRVGQENY